MFIKELTEEDIPTILPLSAVIFDQKVGTFHHDITKWINHYKNNGLLLGAFERDQLVGYVFGYKVNDSEFHYWMGGVDEKFRGKGYGRELLEEMEKRAKEQGYKKITVNTYKEKWKVQFDFLLRHGYKVYKEEQVKWDDGKIHIKSFLEKNI